MLKITFENTWFENLTLVDIKSFFKDNFQANPEIIDMHKIDNNSVLEVKCTDISDNSEFIIYMGEYGFYDLNKNDKFIFNPMIENCDYATQTFNLVNLLSKRNKGILINNKSYNETMLDFHNNAIAQLKKEEEIEL